MNISLFENYGAKNSAPIFSAIRNGLAELGITCSSHDATADVAVIWSTVWSGRMAPNKIVWKSFRASGRPVIVAEVGMLNRGHTWKLGINGTGSTAYYGTERLANRVAQLNLRLCPWHDTGKNIVIALQRPDSEQWVGQPSMDQWLQQTVTTIKKYTSRPIVIRAHPRHRAPGVLGCLIEKPNFITGTYDDFDFGRSLNNAWALVNWNSGPGSQAILQGVPAFVGSSSLAAPVGNLDLAQIENPTRPDRSEWLEMLAHTEWTVQEIATGQPLNRLLVGLKSI